MLKKETKRMISAYQTMRQEVLNEYYNILSNMHGLRKYRNEEEEKKAHELEREINKINGMIAEEKLRDRYGKRYFWRS